MACPLFVYFGRKLGMLICQYPPLRDLQYDDELESIPEFCLLTSLLLNSFFFPAHVSEAPVDLGSVEEEEKQIERGSWKYINARGRHIKSFFF